MSSELAVRWTTQFFAVLRDERTAADDLRGASLRGDLMQWTTLLTGIVVQTFDALGFRCAAKGHRGDALPVTRHEYLGQDVMVFSPNGPAWQFPVAACELENSRSDRSVAYSLWKVLCLRVALRIGFCYRPNASSAPALVKQLASGVVGAVSQEERAALGGDTLVVIGSRNDAGTFPYGFFHFWKLNPNLERFERFERE